MVGWLLVGCWWVVGCLSALLFVSAVVGLIGCGCLLACLFFAVLCVCLCVWFVCLLGWLVVWLLGRLVG